MEATMRFIAEKEAEDIVRGQVREAWVVRDTQRGSFGSPDPYIGLRMSRESTQAIADVLNREWDRFLRNPW